MRKDVPSPENLFIARRARGYPVRLFFSFLLSGLLLSGCYKTYQETLPPQLSSQIDLTLGFSQILATPDQYIGKSIILGGQILSAKRLQHSTELIILQLPLRDDGEPMRELTESQGRFIASQQEFLDPATVPAGTRITLVGTISGSRSQELDETTYTYPILELQHFHIWPSQNVDSLYYGPPPYPYWGPYPYYHPYWGPRGRLYRYHPYWYGW